jgi:glycosyltransferase involved in cell wall biosynthesis
VKPKMIIYAPRIHVGGGLVLLKGMLDTLGDRAVVLLDRRCPADPAPGAISVRLKPGLSSYIFGERALRQMAKRYPDLPILCFSSLPPCRSYAARTTLFLQNRYMVENGTDRLFTLRARVRHWVERKWFRMFHGNVDHVVVQSSSMAAVVKRKFPDLDVTVAPFIDHPPTAPQISIGNRETFDFLFVSAAYPHKNHARLLEAWSLLAKDGQFPTLALVFSEDRNGVLESAIKRMNATAGTKIVRLPEVAPADRFSLYPQAKALIFPSYFETYGLPLVEAAVAGLPILAPELDYVRDSVAPHETFDPYSAVSIARAVRRYLGVGDSLKRPLSVDEFIAHIAGSPS